MNFPCNMPQVCHVCFFLRNVSWAQLVCLDGSFSHGFMSQWCDMACTAYPNLGRCTMPQQKGCSLGSVERVDHWWQVVMSAHFDFSSFVQWFTTWQKGVRWFRHATFPAWQNQWAIRVWPRHSVSGMHLQLSWQGVEVVQMFCMIGRSPLGIDRRWIFVLIFKKRSQLRLTHFSASRHCTFVHESCSRKSQLVESHNVAGRQQCRVWEQGISHRA